MSMTFSQDELFDALLKAVAEREVEETPDSFTVPEFIAATGLSDQMARRYLKAARDLGLVKPDRIARRTVYGYVQRVMGWVLVKRGEPS